MFLLKLFFVLFELGFKLKWTFVGEISISELFLIFSSIYYIYQVRPFSNKTLRPFTILILLILFTQGITEVFVENEVNNALKGMAINVMAFLHVCFLYYYLSKDRRYVLWFALGFMLRYLFMSLDEEPKEMTDELTERQNDYIYFLKFRLVPMTEGLLIILAVFFTKRAYALLALAAGVTLVMLGARSGGTIIVVAGLVAYFFYKSGTKMHRYFKIYATVILIGTYGFYCVYVNQVLKGEIVSGNSEQILKVKNPYDPLNLLMFGRAETFAGLMAFMDKPLTGWGSWAKDPDMMYNTIVTELHDTSTEYYAIEEIPSHSILIGIGMSNGIFAFFFMLLIFIIVVRRGMFLLKYSNKYYYIICFYLIYFSWHMLFSPQSNFRYSIPLAIAFIFVSWELKKKELADNKRAITGQS